MKMKDQALVRANAAVLLFGLAGLFAKLIHVPSLGITFGRVFFSSVTLGICMLLKKESFRVEEKKDLFLLIASGCVLAFHWWSFLEAIQLSTVALGTITFSAYPLFVTFMEPLIFRRKLRKAEILEAAAILIAVFITVPDVDLDSSYASGIAVGLLSSFAYAVLTLLNKNFSGKFNSTKISFYEQSTAAIVLLPIVLFSGITAESADIGLILLLGIFTTALAHTMFTSSLKDISAQQAGICSSLETVYGILFAFLFLQEIPSVREILGAGFIVATVILSQLLRKE